MLLSVLAAAFSLSAQGSLPANQSQPANIITIATVMVNLQDHHSDKKVQLTCLYNNELEFVNASFVPTQYRGFIPATRLTPNNGIRAGPSFI